MDRHVIANMGTELGATTTVFPADREVRRFLRAHGREEDWRELLSDGDAAYDREEEIDLSQLEPLAARPSSPGNVAPVREMAGAEIYQAYIGSSANPGYRDFAVPAEMVRGRTVHCRVSFDINPASRRTLTTLMRDGRLSALLESGARLHQAGCNGCIGMGQAPATNKISLRTVPRNFPGRSGTREDQVYLVSPETAAASALTGVITDPRTLDMEYPRIAGLSEPAAGHMAVQAPLSAEEATETPLQKGPNIVSLPEFEPLPDEVELPILLKLGDGISTDEIMPAGARILPLRSNIPAISRFCFEIIDDAYPARADKVHDTGGHAVVGGENYGQGSSREHAALAPRYLGLRIVLAKAFARIHRQNLINFGVLPLTFENPSDYDRIDRGDRLRVKGLREQVRGGERVRVECLPKQIAFDVMHRFSPRQIEVLLAGGLINWVRQRLANQGE
jgi:aconitate hydratase